MIEWLLNADPLAVWGALLSTVLAIREYIKSKVNIEISFSYASHPGFGNELVLRNLSNVPVIVTYWELVKQSNRFSKPLVPVLAAPDEYFKDWVISAHSSSSLCFRDEDHFSCSKEALNGKNIFFHCHIAGKRFPIVTKVY